MTTRRVSRPDPNGLPDLHSDRLADRVRRTFGPIDTIHLIRIIGLIGVSLTLTLADAAEAFGPSTHLEWNLLHQERVGGTPATVTGQNAGKDGPDQVDDLVYVNAAHGTHRVHLKADVAAASSTGAPILHALGEHEYHLSGSDRSSEVWTLVDGRQLLRATLVDQLTVQGVPLGAFSVEFYWDLGGDDDVLIDLSPPDSIYYTISTRVHLEARGATASSTHEETIPWPGGYLAADLDQTKSLDDYVKLSLGGTSGQPLAVDTVFEVEPKTRLNNFLEGFAGALTVDGHHSAFFDQSAKLIGVIVRDAFGNILPFATVTSASGFDYPVLGTVPVAPLPAQTILSPVAVVANTLGEYASSVPAVHMIDHSGLDKPFTSGVTGFDRYFDFSPTPFAQANYVNNWQSTIQYVLPLTGHLDFDLGGFYWIDRLAIWNRSLENVRIQIADAPTGPWQEIGQVTLQNRNAYPFSYPAEVVALSGEYRTRYLRIQIDSAYKLNTTDSWAYGIVGEVAVSAALSPVPEPGAAGMLVAGGLGIATLARLRRRTERSR